MDSIKNKTEGKGKRWGDFWESAIIAADKQPKGTPGLCQKTFRGSGLQLHDVMAYSQEIFTQPLGDRTLGGLQDERNT